jgi:hypothetical protein
VRERGSSIRDWSAKAIGELRKRELGRVVLLTSGRTSSLICGETKLQCDGKPSAGKSSACTWTAPVGIGAILEALV